MVPHSGTELLENEAEFSCLSENLRPYFGYMHDMVSSKYFYSIYYELILLLLFLG